MDNSKQKGGKIQPLLKWPGGKEKELKYIKAGLPVSFNNYFEPFVGGGSVYVSVDANRYYINDRSEELIALYRIIVSDKRQDFFRLLGETMDSWSLIGSLMDKNRAEVTAAYREYAGGERDNAGLVGVIEGITFRSLNGIKIFYNSFLKLNTPFFFSEVRKNLERKTKRMKVLESTRGRLSGNDVYDNILTALKSAYYMYYRHLYNFPGRYGLDDARQSVVFLFIRNYAYSGMFRYNSKGEFNVPYGGMAYNAKNMAGKIAWLESGCLSKRLSDSMIESLDFVDFFNKHRPAENDFVFLDPPYDSDFSTYANNRFTRDDQQRLASYLLNDCRAKWMLVIKNTDFIFGLYNKPGISLTSFDKKYLVSFMNRNDRYTRHLVIKNY